MEFCGALRFFRGFCRGCLDFSRDFSNCFDFDDLGEALSTFFLLGKMALQFILEVCDGFKG